MTIAKLARRNDPLMVRPFARALRAGVERESAPDDSAAVGGAIPGSKNVVVR